MTAIQALNGRKIAIIDDEKDLAEVTSWEVEEAGYEPCLFIHGNLKNVNELASRIRESTECAVCDHRLSNSGFANFYGAELVATLYDWKFPSVLITQYTEMDTSLSIRKWRHKIPVLLSRDQADASNIAKGIEDCRSELKGDISSIRKPYRTIVRIANIDKESIEAFVPGWNPHKAVCFPTSLVPENIRDVLKPNIRLFAHVNIGAEKSDDLYFKKFELAPEPDENDGLA
jgi:CheY-like chemotaxis protein